MMLGNEPYFTAASEDGFTFTRMVGDHSKDASDTTSLNTYMASPPSKQSTEENLVSDFKGGKILSSKTTMYSGPVCIDIKMTTGPKASGCQFDGMSYQIIAVGVNLFFVFLFSIKKAVRSSRKNDGKIDYSKPHNPLLIIAEGKGSYDLFFA